MGTPTRKTRTIDEQTVFAVQHSIRADALAILCERTASPNEIAKIIGEDVSKVSDHIVKLKEGGSVELVRTEPRRGAVEHYYRATLRPNIPDKEWAKLSKDTRHMLSSLVFQAIVAEGLGALRRGTFDSRLNRHLSWRVVEVDEQGFDELADDEAERLDRVEQIEATSAERRQKSGEDGISAIVAAMMFERAQRGRSPRPEL